jgi:hypothetical protein
MTATETLGLTMLSSKASRVRTHNVLSDCIAISQERVWDLWVCMTAGVSSYFAPELPR